jgi:predicted RNase H-like HicB family nuclease
MKFSALITKEGKWYVARCPELNVTSQGQTFEEAQKNLIEAIELYIESFGSTDLPTTDGSPIWTTVEVPVHA